MLRLKDINSAYTFANFIIIYFGTSCITILYYSALRRYQTFVILLTKCTAGSMSLMLICTVGLISKISCSLQSGYNVKKILPTSLWVKCLKYPLHCRFNVQNILLLALRNQFIKYPAHYTVGLMSKISCSLYCGFNV